MPGGLTFEISIVEAPAGGWFVEILKDGEDYLVSKTFPIHAQAEEKLAEVGVLFEQKGAKVSKSFRQ